MTTLYNLTTLGTILICISIGIITIIRLRLCNGHRRPRLKYTLILGSALIGIAQPILNYTWPGSAALFLSAMILIMLILGTSPLKDYKDTNDFFDTELYDPQIHAED